jgi:type I restriction enzyme, S subunit
MNQAALTGKDVPQTVRTWKRYPKYKDSGVAWLGEIPAGWELRPAFAVFQEQNILNKGLLENNLLSLSYGKIIRKDIDTNYGLLPESFETYQIIFPGNIILRLTDLQNDKRSLRVGLVKEKGIITSAYLCIKAENLKQEYSYYLLHSYDITKIFYSMGDGVRQSMKFSDLRKLPVLIPRIEEQQKIASFLDRETAKIDVLIAKKERFIELLQEKRTALISHAVTKGLNPNVPMKDSGVEWLGEIPAHWGIKKVKYCIDSIEQGWSPSCENHPAEENEWGVLKVGCVNGTEFNSDENKALPHDLEPRLELEIKSGDVLTSRANTRELLGSRLMLCDKLYRLKISNSVINSDFIVLSFGSSVSRFQMERDATGASNSMQNIGQDTIKNILLPLPDLKEQKEIISYIDIKTNYIDTLLTKTRTSIDHLKEYRTALISAAVTGKIDVREEVA